MVVSSTVPVTLLDRSVLVVVMRVAVLTVLVPV